MRLQMTSAWKPVLAAGLLVMGLAGCEGGGRKNHDKAVNAANTKWHSLRSNMMLKLGQQQFDTGDLDEAEKTTADAIGIDSKNAKLYVLAGRIALERGQLERAYQRLQLASEFDPKLPDAPYFQAIVLQRWQRYGDALAGYQKASELQPDNASFVLATCEMFVALNRTDEATDLLKSKVTYFDQNAGIRVALAQLAMMHKKPAEAVDYLQQASLLQPDDKQIIENLALAQIAAGQTSKAIAVLEKLCADPKNADRRDLLRTLANAYQHDGRAADARRTYVRLTQTDPSDSESWIKLGELAWSQGDLAGALLAANRSIALAPKRPEGYVLAGLALQKRDRLDEALRMFDRAAEVAPNSAEPVLLRGMALQHAGRNKDAVQAYTEALRREPKDTRAQQLLAAVSDSSESR
ncbi:MAG: tetratricopeptide repeat protein [Planctomycetes bacterium]|nr:tetratricopeptide repeat protein [Planctomycetota bacterium]